MTKKHVFLRDVGESSMWNIEPWDKKQESATKICELVHICYPRRPKLPSGHELQFLLGVERGYEQSSFVLKHDNNIYGCAFLSHAPSQNDVLLRGCIHPEHRGKGQGSALLTSVLESVSHQSNIEHCLTTAFADDTEIVDILTHWGFREVDRVIWSKLDLCPEKNKTNPTIENWIQSKCSFFEQRSYSVVTGDVFETMRDDWEYAWWDFTMKTCRDIPSKIPFETIPFEDWKHVLHPPMLYRENSLVMLDGIEMIGVLNLSRVVNETINIDFTAVSSKYRQKGLSIVVKNKAFELARTLGAKSMTTQNHPDNPILQINKKLGFCEEAIDLCLQLQLF